MHGPRNKIEKSLLHVRTVPPGHLAFCSANTGVLSAEVKWPGREFHHSRSAGAELKLLSPPVIITDILISYWRYLLSSERLLHLTWLRRQQDFLKRQHTLTRPNGCTTHERFLFHSVHCENYHQHNYVPTEYRGTQSLDPQSKTFPAFMKPEDSLRPLSHFRPKRDSFHNHQIISYRSILILPKLPSSKCALPFRFL
jgi:hypothetical protein